MRICLEIYLSILNNFQSYHETILKNNHETILKNDLEIILKIDLTLILYFHMMGIISFGCDLLYLLIFHKKNALCLQMSHVCRLDTFWWHPPHWTGSTRWYLVCVTTGGGAGWATSFTFTWLNICSNSPSTLLNTGVVYLFRICCLHCCWGWDAALSRLVNGMGPLSGNSSFRIGIVLGSWLVGFLLLSLVFFNSSLCLVGSTVLLLFTTQTSTDIFTCGSRDLLME